MVPERPLPATRGPALPQGRSQFPCNPCGVRASRCTCATDLIDATSSNSIRSPPVTPSWTKPISTPSSFAASRERGTKLAQQAGGIYLTTVQLLISSASSQIPSSPLREPRSAPSTRRRCAAHLRSYCQV